MPASSRSSSTLPGVRSETLNVIDAKSMTPASVRLRTYASDDGSVSLSFARVRFSVGEESGPSTSEMPSIFARRSSASRRRLDAAGETFIKVLHPPRPSGARNASSGVSTFGRPVNSARSSSSRRRARSASSTRGWGIRRMSTAVPFLGATAAANAATGSMSNTRSARASSSSSMTASSPRPDVRITARGARRSVWPCRSR
mmetsp:Transcript_3445/g.14048  ORF Transcript_3445/g.14048 Transcript_3445/m.14048 type:complete len:201 (-) Transcript_3445:3249-3851(-)